MPDIAIGAFPNPPHQAEKCICFSMVLSRQPERYIHFTKVCFQILLLGFHRTLLLDSSCLATAVCFSKARGRASRPFVEK